jgi:hypothetical protein
VNTSRLCVIAVVMIGFWGGALAPGVAAQQPSSAGIGAPTGNQPDTPDNGQSPARSFRPADLLTPPSRLRWGPFALYSMQIMGGFSSVPLLNGSASSGWQENLPMPSVGLFTASTAMGASWRRARSSFSIVYTPSVYRQTGNELNQVLHNGGVSYDRAFGRWQLSIGLSGGNQNQYSFLLQPQPVETVARMRVPFSNLQLMDLIDRPQVLTVSPPQYVASGRSIIRGDGRVSLTRKLGMRDRVSASAGYSVNRDLDAQTQQGAALSPYRYNARSVSLGYSHSFSPRQELGLTAGEQRSDSPQYRATYGRSAQLSYSVRPTRNWSLSASAGPSLGNYQSARQQLQVAVSGGVTRQWASTMTSLTYSRGLYVGDIAGGYQSDAVSLAWAPRPKPRAHLIYSFSAGYQRLSSQQIGVGVQGWTAGSTLAVPLTRSVQLFSQYAFFDQRYGQAMAARQLQEMRRHMVLVGLRWDFQR